MGFSKEEFRKAVHEAEVKEQQSAKSTNPDIAERAVWYNLAYPKYPPLVVSEVGKRSWVYGMWIVGNRYKGTGYYGSYPHGFLKRVMTMFIDVADNEILHLFSGTVEARGIKFDVNASLKPDVVGDAHELSKYFEPESKTVIFSDPPYSVDDALHYGAPMIKRQRVVNECIKVLRPGGWLCWLDQVQVAHANSRFSLQATIGVMVSSGHRFRVLCIYQKRGDQL